MHISMCISRNRTSVRRRNVRCGRLTSVGFPVRGMKMSTLFIVLLGFLAQDVCSMTWSEMHPLTMEGLEALMTNDPEVIEWKQQKKQIREEEKQIGKYHYNLLREKRKLKPGASTAEMLTLVDQKLRSYRIKLQDLRIQRKRIKIQLMEREALYYKRYDQEMTAAAADELIGES